MTTLTGKQIANTYKQLLQVGSGNIGLTTTLQDVQDGDSNNSALQLSNSTVNINGLFGLNGVILTVGASTLNALTSSVVNITTGNDTVLFTQAGVSVSTASTSLTAVVNPTLSITNLYASTGIFLAGSAIPSTGDVAAVSALTSVNKAAITSINTVVAAVSALTSVNKAAITSINSGTFNSLDVETSVQIGDFINLDGKVLTITGDTDDTFKITAGANGATTLETVDTAGNAANLTIDADGIIRLDSGSTYGNIQFAHDGTIYGDFHKSGDNIKFRSGVSDGDLILSGYDGGVGINALTLDMSAAGKAFFNAGATFADDVTVENINLSDKVLTITGDTDDTFKITTGGSGATTLSTIDTASNNGRITLDADGYIELDSGGDYGEIYFDKQGTNYGQVFTGDGSDFRIRSNVDNADMKFAGKDGGTFITALTLDMSEGGKAIFNKGATFANNVELPDNVRLTLGATADVHNLLELYHDGTNSILRANGAPLWIQTDDTVKITKDNGTEAIANFIGDGAVELYHDASKKFETTATGATVTGGIVAGSATVDDISLDGKVLTITGDTGDTFSITTGAAGFTTIATTDAAGADGHLLLDIDGAIILDAGDSLGQTQFKKAGTEYLRIFNSGSPATIHSIVSDADLVLSGNDGGSTVNALTLDMSAAGAATFNNDVIVNNTIKLPATTGPLIETTGVLATTDITLLRASGGGSGGDGQFGFDIKYMGARTGNNNSYSLFMHNTTGTYVEAMTVIQDGKVGIGNTTPTSTLHVTGDATVDDINLNGKVLTITGDTDDTFTITSGANGSTTLATTDTAGTSGNIILDADGIIQLDSADNGGVQLRKSGTEYGTLFASGDNINIKSQVNNKDIVFRGLDDGADITALTLDMSDAGKAIFNAGATFADDVTVEDINLSGKVLTITGDTDDTFTITSGANGETTLATVDTAGTSGGLTLDADGRIFLDAADNGIIMLKKGGTRYATIESPNANLYLRNDISDGDVIIRGYDSGSLIDALTFDMSEAGKATFNNSINTPNAVFLSTDGEKVVFGADQEITIRHVHNSGLNLRNSQTGDVGGFVLTLQTGESEVVTNDVIGTIDFQAYNESSASDSRLVAAGIEAVAEQTFNSTANTTRLKFKTAVSETATEKMTLTGAGNLGIGTTAPTELLHIASTGDAIIKLEADTDNADETHNPKIVFSQDGGGATARVGYLSGQNKFEVVNEYGDALLFGTNNTERMRIKNAGNVGINETDPLKKLHVDGPALSTVKTLTDASTVTSDFDVGQNFTLTLAGNRTLGAPSNVDAGQVGSIFIIQDGTGSRTLAYNSIWKFAGGTAPTLSTAAGAIDRLDYIVQSGTAIQAVLTKAYA